MTKFFLGACLTVATAAPAMAQPARTGGGAAFLSYVFAPLVGLAEIQARMSPEKPSCWNDGAAEVAGCRLVEKVQSN